MTRLIDSLLTKDKKLRPNIDTIINFPKIWEKVGNLLGNKSY